MNHTEFRRWLPGMIAWAAACLCLQAQSIVINEISYDPPGNARTEFIELHNPTTEDIDVSGWKFTKGIEFTFPAGSMIAAGDYAVVTMDPAEFLAWFGFAAYGPFSGKLSGDGELVILADASGVEIDRVDYKAAFPWPISPASEGASMELIHPSLDNDLGGSWRGSVPEVTHTEHAYISKADTGWHWRAGITEASSPTSAWRDNSFVEDQSWSGDVQAPIGYGEIASEAGTLTLNTVISGMQGNYNCIFARKTFTIAPGEIPDALQLSYAPDDGIVIWINGHIVAYRNVSTIEPTISTTATEEANEGIWYDLEITYASGLLVEGQNTIAVQLINTTIDSPDLGFDLELKRPPGLTIPQPTPGAQNSVYSSTAPPQIRQVSHFPKQPASTEATTITAKITDPEGVGQVNLTYQIVAPGAFIPARFPRTRDEVLANPSGERPVNPAFEDPANWTTVPMFDDGTNGDAVAADGIYSAIIPAQPHRTLVRYRISAEDIPGTSIRVPYADDKSLNFAYFVYNGVPDYVASGKVWPKEMLTALPVYHWIIRSEDMSTLQAYNSSEQFANTGTADVLAARRSEEWEGAFVYDGIVYDHVCTRLRGGNTRYVDYDNIYRYGKRHYKFRFNTGHYLQAKNQKGEPYPTKWKALAMNRMHGTKGGNGWGMPEEIGATLWKTFGVPAQNTHWLHFRVVDAAAEAPNQYYGDFWGLYQAVEEYDGNYLDARGMAKGNLYKMSDWIWDAKRQRRYQSSDMVRDGSEFNNIRDNLHGGQSAAWLNQHVNYDKWYRYSAVAEAIRHYDLFPYTDNIRHSLKNLAWYFEPTGADPTRGVCMFLPYDWDASFGPSFNNGWDHANNALYGWDASTQDGMPYAIKPEMKIEHRNILREFRDLIWQPDQVNKLMDDRASVIAEFSKADQARWGNAPTSAGSQIDTPLTTKVQDMKNFCFTGWFGSSGPPVFEGRDAHLDMLADSPDAGLLPAKPTITYTGATGHPLNGLSFQTSAFSDPQGAGTFAGMQWRIGQIEDPIAPAHNPNDDFIMEYTPVWESGTRTTFASTTNIPAGALKSGRTYRARVRMQDNTGRWSHWSSPYQFTTTTPDTVAELQQNLVISEFMYHPHDSEDYEYIELLNISSTLTLDLTDVRFTKGIDFDFAGSAVTSLAPGARVLVVKNQNAFESRYGTSLPIAGVWEEGDSLSNGGEQLKLSYGSGAAIHDFVYDDAPPWPVSPDGDGPSIMLIDPMSAPDHSVAANWKASDTPFGSPGNEDSRFAVWLSQRGVTDPSAQAAPGMDHTLMYAVGADLASDPSAALPTFDFTPGEDEKSHLTFSFRTRTDSTEVSYIVETSTNMTTWLSAEGITEPHGPPVDNGDGTQTHHVRLLSSTTDDPHRFIRLRVVLTR